MFDLQVRAALGSLMLMCKVPNLVSTSGVVDYYFSEPIISVLTTVFTSQSGGDWS
jgi:hypothetical protein